jgi:hypothetical protein
MTSVQTQPTVEAVRTYGGWRRARGMGLFGVGPVGTVVVLACLVVPLVLAAIALPLARPACCPQPRSLG